MPQALRIMAINAKGGCGKTTVATNLAVAYARQGWQVALVDQDAQASATDWASQRGERKPKIDLVPQRDASMYQTRAWQNRLPQGTERAVIDAASVVDIRQFNERLRDADIFLVPVMPSALDIRAGSKFIAGLLTHQAYRRRPVPIGVVANRVVRNTRAWERLKHFLNCLEVPTVATFADSQLYLHAAEEGAGVLDFQEDDARVASTGDDWNALVRWIETQASAAKQPSAVAAAPLARPARPGGSAQPLRNPARAPRDRSTAPRAGAG